MALLRSALPCKLKIRNSTRRSTNKNSICSNGMAGLSSRAWPGPGPGQGPGQGPVCSRAGVGQAPEKNYIPEAPHVCRVVWRGEAPHPSLLSADSGTVGNCVPKLQARPIGVLILGKVAAPSSPKHLLSHFPRPLFASSLGLSFASVTTQALLC